MMMRRKNPRVLIAPSVLSADFSRLGEELAAVEEAGADWIHVDVMDGHFVPNITLGPLVVHSMRPATKLPLDVHLMIAEPERYIAPFAKAGADLITFHIEACKNPKSLVSMIRRSGKKVGVSIKPRTSLSRLDAVIDDVDLVLVMTVEPGFGGQSFMRGVLPKIKTLRAFFGRDIEVDGGVNAETAREVISAGANIIVAGTAVFGAKDYTRAIRRLRGT